MKKILVLAISAYLVDQGSSLGNDVDMARVKDEWPVAARRLDEKFARARGVARAWDDNPNSPGKTLLTEATFAIDGGMEKVDISRSTRTSTPVKLADLVYCVGDSMAFRLHRRAGDRAYNVVGIGKTSKERDLYESTFGEFVHAHHGVNGRPMSRLLDSPGFQIKGAESIDRAGRKLMKVDCVSGPNSAQEQISFDLDPEIGWIVKTCRYRPGYDHSMLFTSEIEYGDTHDGVPIPRILKIEEPGGKIKHCEFKAWTFTPTPPSEFSMTHYGLPDLVHASKPRSNIAYWLGGMAILVGGMAWLLRRVASRVA